MKKVSVIIPVYNAEKYIRECIGSLLRQTLEDIEIICVLDCPKDRTGDIIKEAAHNDDRICVVENEENIGAACSRNKGMGYVTAPYVIFLDADDVFESDMLEVLYCRIEETKADMCLFDFDTFYDEEGWLTSVNIQESQYKGVFSVADLPENGLSRLGAATWNRIYRSSFLRKNELKFQDLKTGNDVYMGIMSLLLAERIAHTRTNKAFLHYRLGIPGQITAKGNPYDTCMAYQKTHAGLRERGLWEQYKKCFWIKFLMTLTREITNGSNEEYNRQAYHWIHEEGVSALEIASVKEEDFDCPYYAVELRKFMEKDYENGWFRYSINLQMQLEYYADKIIELCNLWMREEKSIAVWGAGPYGRTILRFFDENYIRCEIVLDIDKKKQGTCIEQRRIYAFEDVMSSLDIIIVANQKYAEQIREIVSGSDEGIYVITIEEMVGRSDIL